MRKTNFLVNLSLLILILILLLFFIEISFRIFLPQITFDELEENSPAMYRESDFIGFELKPNIVERHFVEDEFDVTVKTNSLGYRDNEFSNNPKRILVLGDSFVFGWGVENNEVFTEKLEEKIDHEVINAGFASGKTPDESYLFLKRKGLLLKPDIVILAISITDDLYDIEHHEWITVNNLPVIIKDPDHYIDNGHFLVKKDALKLIVRLDWFLMKHLHSHIYFRKKAGFLYQMLSYKIEGIEAKCVFCEEFWIAKEDSWKKLKRLLIADKKMLDENNIKFYLLIIPRREQIYDNYWETYLKGLNSININRERTQQEITTFANENDIDVIKILPSFRNYSKTPNSKMLYFPKDVHWNKEGHKLVAEIIYEKLINEDLISIPKGQIEVIYVK